MGRKERAKERREKRLQEITELRKIPYAAEDRWWSSETVAVVTGANRGIGYEIARQLAGHGLKVIITSRDITKGQEATTALREGGLNVAFHQLDILDPVSVKQFAEWMDQNFGGIDILVNNAGVNYNLGSNNSVEFAEKVILTNYFGTKRMVETMIPLMKHSSPGARIVNVSSRLGRLNGRRNRLGDATLREQLADEESLSIELIDRTVICFLEQVKHGNWTSGGWPQMFTDYSLSKLVVNAYTRLMARTLCSRPEGQKIHMNCYCPGWVKTAMTGWQGNISAKEGADTGVWLSLLSGQPVAGKFFAERREISF
ncbi:PREDICTED: (+)-neomenthol dehydrogenase-like [Nelumbo nucifera]|uniref:Short-chain dehydrogenase/reductase n=1 Tax=Nelumbo nucifera TaxID=4432 RepID=A0A1U8AGY5_NELNU|nr:PREDICTED: (+)-neomenthol dehydrogenase-like [Nelumbo nucifera]XP_010265012.1 PREDICTED: (+)-neomenthol dehydrogenase-like [Nelumbo nucifera]